MTTTQQDAQVEELIALLRREGAYSGVWFSEHLLNAADTLAALSTASVPPQAVDTGEVARLQEALEQIASQKPERDRTDDYNQGWEAARYAARNIARAALEPQAKDM